MGFNWAVEGLSKYCRPAEGVLTAYCAIHFVWIEEMCASAIEFSAIAKCLLSRLETGWGGGFYWERGGHSAFGNFHQHRHHVPQVLGMFPVPLYSR